MNKPKLKRIDLDEPPGQPPAIDDLAISCDMVHLERMSENCYSLLIHRGRRQANINIYTNSKKCRHKLKAVVFEDDIK
jgi:hypothetical protein